MVVVNRFMSDLDDLQTAQADIIEEFAFFDDWQERYQHIIDLGRALPPFPESLKLEENKVMGCQAQVWFAAEMQDGRIHFQANSDAAIVSGLIALLLRIYSGRTPEAILKTEPEFIPAIGLADHLSVTRSNGLASMIRAVKNLAARAVEAK